MTIDIKALAKQAGSTPYEHSQPWRESTSFTPTQLAEFVRLVRADVLEEAALVCNWQAEQLVYPSTGNAIALVCAQKIRSLK